MLLLNFPLFDHKMIHFVRGVGDMHLNKCYEVIFNFTMERDIRLDKLAIGVPYKAKSNIER